MRQIALIRTVLVISFLLADGAWAVSKGPIRARDKCTTVIVGKDATVDGSVILAHNEDFGKYEIPLRWQLRERHEMGEMLKLRDGQIIPQVEETYAFFWPAAICSGMNEFQVMIVDNSGSCRKDMVPSSTGIEFDSLIALALGRSRSAREAVQIMGRLIDECGYKCIDGPNGDIFSVADPNEGWWMEVTTSGHWVAQKVPNDAFVVIANQFRIETLDPKNPSQSMACAGLIDYAKEKGWYDPTQGAFQFRRAFGETVDNCFRREWRGNCLLGGRAIDEDDNVLAVVPDKKLTPRDLIAFLRDHFEGSPYDLTKGYREGSPHSTSERGICRMYTDTSTVAQLRAWLPSEIGGLCWIAVGTPCSSAYTPYYLGVTDFPKPYAFLSKKYDRENAFWVFNSLDNLVDQHYGLVTSRIVPDGTLQHGEITAIEYVSRCWRAFEDKEFAMQEAVEKVALELYQKDKSLARSFLNTHSNALGMEAFMTAQELADTLRTEYYK